jgi:hydrogenase maturation protease
MKDINQTKKTLFAGIGNYGRADDALGWKFIDAFSDWDNQYDLVYRYQLQIEDAELISNYERVIFIDASHQQLEGGFSFYKCMPNPNNTITTHQLLPETVLWLAGELFRAPAEAYIMAICGIHWDLDFEQSETATHNLNQAVKYLRNWLNLEGLKV